MWNRVCEFLKPFAPAFYRAARLVDCHGRHTLLIFAAYFGVVPLMVTYFTKDLHWTDAAATRAVSIFTMSVTLFAMIGLSSFAESFGLRPSHSSGVAPLHGGTGRLLLASRLLGTYYDHGPGRALVASGGSVLRGRHLTTGHLFWSQAVYRRAPQVPWDTP